MKNALRSGVEKITHLIRFINADSQVIAGVVVLPI